MSADEAPVEHTVEDLAQHRLVNQQLVQTLCELGGKDNLSIVLVLQARVNMLTEVVFASIDPQARIEFELMYESLLTMHLQQALFLTEEQQKSTLLVPDQGLVVPS